MVRKHLWISGKVQGVFYRYSTTQKAMALEELTGWVKNLPDGRVEALVEGPEAKVKALVEWCHQGPSNARVDGVEVADEPYQGNLGPFNVAY